MFDAIVAGAASTGESFVPTTDCVTSSVSEPEFLENGLPVLKIRNPPGLTPGRQVCEQLVSLTVS